MDCSAENHHSPPLAGLRRGGGWSLVAGLTIHGVLLDPARADEIASYAPAGPVTPEAFWAIALWVIVPALLGIWSLAWKHQQTLRQANRRIRQLEASLARATAPPSAPAAVPAPVISPARPSTLTSRIPAPDGKVPALGATSAIRLTGVT